MKKIFFVADASSIHIAKWVNYFIEQEYEVYLASFSSDNKTKARNFFLLSNKKVEQKGKNLHYILGIPKLVALFKEIEPDIINAHFSYSMGGVALFAKKLARIDCVFSVVCHGSDILAPSFEPIISKLNRYILINSSKIFAVSNQIKDKIALFNLKNKAIFVGQYGLELEKYDTYFINDRNIDIISNRSYESNSQIDTLLTYIDSINNYKLNIVFILPNISEMEFQRLKEKYHRISFHKHMEHSDMIELVRQSKVYVSNTKSDGTSLSLLEAMELGCIPLVSDIISNRSWILDTINGYLFYDQQSFLESVDKIFANYDELKINISAINKKLIENKAIYNQEMKKIENFLLKK